MILRKDVRRIWGRYSTKLSAQLGSGEGLVTIRGNTKARVLIVTPSPTKGDCEKNLPMSGVSGQLVHSYMKTHKGFDTQEDALVVPSNIYMSGGKRKTGSTEIRKAVAELINFGMDKVICFGVLAMGHVFGAGKSSAASLEGRVIHVAEFPRKPVLVLPDYTPLEIFAETEGMTKWQMREADLLLKHEHAESVAKKIITSLLKNEAFFRR